MVTFTRCEELKKKFFKRDENTCCFWFTCSGLVIKAVRGNWQESVVTLRLWTFYYVKGKLLLMSQCFVMCYHWQTLSHMASFIQRNRFAWIYSHSFDVLRCLRVSVTWLQCNSYYLTDHTVVVPWPWVHSNPFYVICGQQTVFDFRVWQAYPLREFWGQGWERPAASSDWDTLGLGSVTYSSVVLLNYLIYVLSIPRAEI